MADISKITLPDGNTYDIKDAGAVHGVVITGGSQTSTSTADGGSNVFTFNKSDGTTATFTVKNGSKGTNATTTSVATQSANGLMSANDKKKLDGIASGATAVSETTVSGWGFTKNTGSYSKPSGGIPKTDLASAVQTSLGKADTALQAVPALTYEELWTLLTT